MIKSHLNPILYVLVLVDL